MQEVADVMWLFEGLPGFNDATRDVSPFVVACAPACSGWPMANAITSSESAAELLTTALLGCCTLISATIAYDENRISAFKKELQ